MIRLTPEETFSIIKAASTCSTIYARIEIQLPATLKAQFSERCLAEGKTVSAVLRSMIIAYVEKTE